MRRTPVLALALMSIALMGSSCEFYASSGNQPPPKPPPEEEKPPSNEAMSESGEPDPDTGLLVVVGSTGDSRPTPEGGTHLDDPVETALAVSVLSASSPRPQADPPADASALGTSNRVVALRAVAVAPAGGESPVPEPGAVWLYGVGTLLVAWRLRRRRAPR